MKLTRREKLLILLEFVGEGIANFFKKIFARKSYILLSCAISLLFVLLAIFIAKKQAEAQAALPFCSTISPVASASPGVNCKLSPYCTEIVSPTVPAPGINCQPAPLCSAVASPNPGVNCRAACADLPSANRKPGINCLPYRGLALCTDLAYPTLANPGINCRPACSSLIESGISPQAGTNCVYYAGFPLCNELTEGRKNHRVTCADLIDLPLCSEIPRNCRESYETDPTSLLLPLCSSVVKKAVNPGINCAERCSNNAYSDTDPTADPKQVRSIHYAIFNSQCIRFCDEVDDENALYAPDANDPNHIIAKVFDPNVSNTNSNCVTKKCHQLAAEITPINTGENSNCDILTCNLLTPDELNKPKFRDATKKYCDGDTVKCFNFTEAQLPHVMVRKQNPMCQLHNCTPLSSTCDIADPLNPALLKPEFKNILARGAHYTSVYESYIMGGYSLQTNSICNPVQCRQIVYTQYRCTLDGITFTGDDTKDKIRNNSCDVSGVGSKCDCTNQNAANGLPCAVNYCFKTVDCNKPANYGTPECMEGSQQSPLDDKDPFDSWFYRPKPMDKAVHTSTGILRNMTHYPLESDEEDRYCYSDSQIFQDNGWGFHQEWDMGLFTIDWGWYHDYGAYGDPRSPGSCSNPKNGARGTGYSFLCGWRFLSNRAPDESVYFRGYASTDFSGTYPRHKVTICTRFANTLTFNTCGKRECGIVISGWGGDFWTTHWGDTCGGDVCRELYVDEANEAECMMTSGLDMNGNGCSSGIDGNIRVRAVKHNNKICAYLDSIGATGFNGMFFNGSETLADGKTCVNDPVSADGCQGYDSNSNPARADLWRNLIKVRYVDNNRPSGPRGYLDVNGKLYREQDCPKVTMRIPPPDLYNVGTIANAEKLFSPPLSIRAVSIRKGDSDAIPEPGQVYAKTDFIAPEITVQFGMDTYKLGLNMDCTGYDDASACNGGFVDATTTFNRRQFSASLSVRKDYSEVTKDPIFCLYRKVRNQASGSIEFLRVGCVMRNQPDPSANIISGDNIL